MNSSTCSGICWKQLQQQQLGQELAGQSRVNQCLRALMNERLQQ
jgi:hypothetical protein